MPIRNGTITTGGTAQDALPARIGRSFLLINAYDEDLWVNFGANAAENTGELIPEGSSSAFSVERFPDIGGRVSILGATTGSDYSIREA
jgi:hypothetical protein